MSSPAQSKLSALLLTAIFMSSLTAFGGARPEFESSYNAVSIARRAQSAHSLTTRKDAKGNFMRLTVKDPDAAPDLWSQLDLADYKVPGTSTAKAYATLSLKTPAEPIIVAVLDSGVDVTHPDLAGMIYVNEKEANGLPGVDNDGDGYAGNVNGWNFIGNKNGTNLGASSLELAREVGRMRKLGSTRALTSEKITYKTKIEGDLALQKGPADDDYNYYSELQSNYLSAFYFLQKFGLKEESLKAVNEFQPQSNEQTAAKNTMLSILNQGADSRVIASKVEEVSVKVKFYLNPDFDPSSVIGDNPNDLTEKYYGNANVRGLGADHGTHCSGIIGALRGNGIGSDGQSNFVKIMPIRAVPDGDERDKDIANGIRYAVDHGARIISMSFGKPYSPHKELVDAAVEYAESKGVLLVHAAGNDSQDNDTGHNFPTAKYLSGAKANNWLEIGASTRTADGRLPAKFSNYGATMVDLFAPGKDIYSTTPDGTYASFSGTSMATPEVAGIAALILSQRPDLTGQQVRELLISTVTTFPGLMVNKPNDGSMTPTTVPFSSLSVTGGVVNALKALLAI